MARLRLDTAQAHTELERRLDIYARIASEPARRTLVERFSGLHRGADKALAPWLSALDGLEFETRRRDERFQQDLRDLGVHDAGELALCPVPTISSLAGALGLFYVLEGSSLGGRVIRKQVEQGGGDMRGLSFLDPYGLNTGQMWKRFVLVLEREVPACCGASVEDLVSGARDGFELATAWLCPPDRLP